MRNFSKLTLSAIAVALASLSSIASAQLNRPGQEMALVTRSEPNMQRVATPQRVCEEIAVQGSAQQNGNGLGMALGAIAGVALGNQVGQGDGKTAAMVLGGIGGAALGNGSGSGNGASGDSYGTRQSCHYVNEYSDKVNGYKVEFEYNGVRYQGTTRREHQPGSLMPVRVNVVAVD